MDANTQLQTTEEAKAMTFDEWIKTECFQEPPEYALDLARAAWKAGRQSLNKFCTSCGKKTDGLTECPQCKVELDVWRNRAF